MNHSYAEKEELQRIFLTTFLLPKKWGKARAEFIREVSSILKVRKDGLESTDHKRKLTSIFESSYKKARRHDWIQKVDSKWKLTRQGIASLRGETCQAETWHGKELLCNLRRSLDIAPKGGENWTPTSSHVVDDVYWFLRSTVDNNWPPDLPDLPDQLRNYDRNYVRYSWGSNEKEVTRLEKAVRNVSMLPLDVQFRWISRVYFWLLKQKQAPANPSPNSVASAQRDS